MPKRRKEQLFSPPLHATATSPVSFFLSPHKLKTPGRQFQFTSVNLLQNPTPFFIQKNSIFHISDNPHHHRVNHPRLRPLRVLLPLLRNFGATSYMDCKILRPFSVSTSSAAHWWSPFRGRALRLPTLTSAGSSGLVPGLGCRRVSINRQRLFGSFSGLSRVKLTASLNQNSSDHDRIVKFLPKAASGQPLESDEGSFSSKSGWESAKDGIDAFYRFTRPHTVIGTTLSIMSVSLLAVEKMSDLSPLFFIGVLEAIVAALLMNVYIVGLNQLSDIEIDKVNKPYLPLASGEYSNRTGMLIVTSFAVMSFWLGWIVGSWPLFWALFISFILGTAYSINLPMLRWKRSALVAAMCILAVRAVIVQLAFYLHVQTHVYRRPAVFPRPLLFATAFMSFFSVVIALFKDIPDIEGDKIFGIQSYTVRLGQERVFWICIALLEMAYGVAICVGAISPNPWSKLVTVLGHSIMASMLWIRAKSTNLKSKAAITAFYMFVWKLFYAEYLLIPLVR